MAFESQRVVLSDVASICKRASDLFEDAGGTALKANAIGVLPSEANPDAAFDPAAFENSTLSECTPIDAAAVFLFLQHLQTLINTEVTIANTPVVLGSAILKMGLASR